MRSSIIAMVCAVGAFTVGRDVAAHAPHDVATVVALSPDYANDGIVFARMQLTNRMLFARSTDRGRSWSLIGVPMMEYGVSSFAFSPDFAVDQTAFATTTSNGVYRTDDAGLSWNATNLGLLDLAAEEIALSPDFGSDGTAHVATHAGIFRTTDGGDTWSDASTGLTDTVVATITATSDPNVLFAGRRTIFRSDDAGLSWTPLQTYTAALADIATSPNYAIDTTVLLSFGRFGGGIEVSTDAGANFTSTAPGDAFVNDMEFLPDGRLIVATETDGCYVGDGLFGPWTLTADGFEILSPQTENHYADVAVSPDFANDGTVFVAAFEGLHHSVDGALTWQQNDVYSQLVNKRVRFAPDFATSGEIYFGNYGGGLYAYRLPRTTASARGPVHPTTGAGGSSGSQVGVGPAGTPIVHGTSDLTTPWTARTMELGTAYCIALTLSPEFETDRTLTYGFAGMWRSITAGQAWDAVPLPAGVSIVRDVAYSPKFESDLTVFASTSKEPQLRSVDGGMTWAPLTGGLPASLNIQAIALSPTFDSDGVVLLAGDPDGVWRSSDGGDTWVSSSAGLTTNVLRAIAVSPAFENDDLALVGSVGEGLFRSLDGGLTWSPSNTGLPTGEPLIVESIEFSPDAETDGTVFVALLGHGVWKSVDLGVSWQPVGPGLPPSAPRIVAVSPNYAHDGIVVVSTYDWSWISHDAGSSWERLPGFQRVDDIHQSVGPVSGAWLNTAVQGALVGAVSSAKNADAERSFTFHGDTVRWHARRDPMSGFADVLIDGALVATLDLYSSVATETSAVFEYAFTDLDWHTITIRVVGTASPRSAETFVRSDGFSYTF